MQIILTPFGRKISAVFFGGSTMPSHNLDFDWTLAHPITFSGPGLHTGQHATVSFVPTSSRGLWWVTESERWPCQVEYVKDTRYCTTMAHGSHCVATVEHLLSALYGCGISALDIHVEGVEIPIGDGSSHFWCQAFQQVGYRALSSPRQWWVPAASKRFWGENGSWIEVIPSSCLSMAYSVSYPYPRLLTQSKTYEWSPVTYPSEIAPARTFGFEHEIIHLQQDGLIQGATLDNALLVTAEGYGQPLRFSDEVIRHKLLDLCGDLALVGCYPQIHIAAYKAGHALHIKMVEWLRNQFETDMIAHG